MCESGAAEQIRAPNYLIKIYTSREIERVWINHRVATSEQK